jgi:hypothetical protein
MKYDDMNYSNTDWKSDRGLLSEAYEDLYKVYAERNREESRKQKEKEDQERWKKKEEEQKARDMADVQELPPGYEGHRVRHHSDKLQEGTKGTKAEREEADKDDDGELSKKEKDEANKKRHDEGKPHLCATRVEHRVHGLGDCIYAEHAQPDSTGYVSWYNVKFNHGIRTVNTQDLNVLSESHHGEMKEEGAENVRREGDVLEKKELLLGDEEDDLDEDDPKRDGPGYDHDGNKISTRDDFEDNPGEGYEKVDESDDDDDDDDRDLRDVWKQTQDDEDAEKKKKKGKEMKAKVAQAIASNYDEYGLGTFEEKTKEITLNELWAISGSGEDIWTESGDATNEMKAKVGDTIFFTWNYRPNDKDACRSLCKAKIVS